MSTDHTDVTPPFDPRSLDGAGEFHSQSIVTIESAGVAVTDGTAQSDVGALLAPGQLSGSTRATVTAGPSDAIEFRVFRAGSPVRRLRLGGHRYTFGSGEGCSIRLNDPALRPMHAVLVRDEARILVRAYSVPIEVNQTRIGESTLKVGDVLTIGSYRFELLSTSAATVVQDGVGDTVAEDAASYVSSAIRSPAAAESFVPAPELSSPTPEIGSTPETSRPPSPAAVAASSPRQSFDEWNDRLREEVRQWRARRAEADRRDVRSDERENQLQGRETELWSRADNLHQREQELKKQESAAIQIHQEFERKQLELLRLRQENLDRQAQFAERETEFKQVETAYQEQVELATRQLQQSQEQADTATAAVGRMREQFVALNEQLEELTNQQQEIERHDVQRLAEFDRQKADLTLARNQAIEQRNQAHQERDHAIDGIARSAAERRLAEEKLANAAQELAAERTRSETQKQQLADSRSESERFQLQIEQLQSAVEAAQLESARLRAQYSEASQSIARLEALNRQIEASGQNERTAWSIETGELRDTVQQLSVDLASANAELSDLQSSNAALIVQVNDERAGRQASQENASAAAPEDWSVLKTALARATEKLSALKSVYDETLDQIDQADPQAPRAQIQLVNGLASIDAGTSAQDVPTAGQLAARFDANVEELAELIDGLMHSASSATEGEFNAHETWARRLDEASANPPPRFGDIGQSSSAQDAEGASNADAWNDAVSDLSTVFGSNSPSSLVSLTDAAAFSGGDSESSDAVQQTADVRIISPLLPQDVAEISVHQTDGLTSTVTPTADEVSTVATAEQPSVRTPELSSDAPIQPPEAVFKAAEPTQSVRQELAPQESAAEPTVNWADVVGADTITGPSPEQGEDQSFAAASDDQTVAANQATSIEAGWASPPETASAQWASGVDALDAGQSPEPEHASASDDGPGAFELAAGAGAGSLASLLINDLDSERSEPVAEATNPAELEVSEAHARADDLGLTPAQLAVLSASEESLNIAAQFAADESSETTSGGWADDGQSDHDGYDALESSSPEAIPSDVDTIDPQAEFAAAEYSAEAETYDGGGYAEAPSAVDDDQYADDDQFSEDGYGVSAAVEYQQAESGYEDLSTDGSEQSAYGVAESSGSGYQYEPSGYVDDQPQTDANEPSSYGNVDENDSSAPADEVSAGHQIESVDGADGDEEDSIEAYMNRLLNRVQGGPSAAPARQPQPPVAAVTEPKPEPEFDTDAGSPADGFEQPSVEPIHPDEELAPRSQAPEGQSMAAMRELANQSARNAINRSTAIQSRDTQLRAVMKLGQAVVAVLCGVAAFMFVAGALKMVAVVAALVIAAICVNEARVLMSDQRDRREHSGPKEMPTDISDSENLVG